MKYFLFSVLALFVSLPIAFAAKYKLTVDGMSCGSCEKKITDALKATGRCKSESVVVSQTQGTAEFETVEGKDFSEKEVKDLFIGLKYEVKSFQKN
jgi:copper chaperone CopZ